ncbi:MAG TPA: LPS export ABC transporter permease LptG [Gammaproteobacteria bacterium]|nr:LPS export ABC transporter permease LptG [Gammaproteobacteria bacterium]
MNLLARYIVGEVLRGVAITLAALTSIVAFVDTVAQLGDVGTNDYGFAQAAEFVALGLPAAVVDVLPAAALIGALLALGNLAVHRELVVMRASGVAPTQLLGAVSIAGLMLVVVMVLLGESLAPSLAAYAREMRTRALHNDVDLEGGQSAWLKAGDHILNFRRQEGALEFRGGVFLFELGPRETLTRIARADSADVGLGSDWVLKNYAETRFAYAGPDRLPGRIEAERQREVHKDYGLSPDLLGLAVVREDLLTTPGLKRYIAYLRSNDLDATKYLVAYWLRMANTVSVLLMTVLALPFVFGSLRSAGAGGRLVVGLVIGLAYYVASQMLAHGGEVFGIDPRIVAWTPTAVLLLVTGVAFWRLQRPG